MRYIHTYHALEQADNDTPDTATNVGTFSGVLTDEQRRRVADALENAQSENTRRNYAGQFRKFRAWCEREEQSALPAQPEVVAAYAAELAEDGKSMSTIRLAIAAIVDAHKSVGLESPQTTGVTETLRGLSDKLASPRSRRDAGR